MQFGRHSGRTSQECKADFVDSNGPKKPMLVLRIMKFASGKILKK